jgi:hypothetical protein
MSQSRRWLPLVFERVKFSNKVVRAGPEGSGLFAFRGVVLEFPHGEEEA